MTTPSLLGSLALVASTGLVLAAACAIAARLCWPALERWASAWHPQWRVRLYSAFAIAPIAFSLVTLLLCLAPGLVGHWTGHEDHCASHPGHPHLCLVHPSVALSWPLAFGLMLFVAGVGAIALRTARWTLDARREQRLLDAGSRDRLAQDVSIVGSTDLFALTGGFFRTRIWLSSALHEALTPDEREVVVAHERAHVRQRDPLRGWFATAFSGAHLPSTRRAVLAALQLASEQACDARAADVVGDRLRVAETLVRIEGLLRGRSCGSPYASATSAVIGSTVPDRVHRLLAEEAPEPEQLLVTPLVLAFVVAGLLLVEPLHHLVEHLIALVFAIL